MDEHGASSLDDLVDGAHLLSFSLFILNLALFVFARISNKDFLLRNRG